MRRLGLLTVIGFALMMFPALLTGGAANDKIILFNGKNLDGWIAEGVTEYADRKNKSNKLPVWKVEAGKIVCEGSGFGFLRYDGKQFDDFHFHVEYRMPNKGRNNSGIGIRTVPFDPRRSRDTRPSFACYEIQLLDDAGKPPTKHSTGSLYRYVAPKVNAAKPAPEWNIVDIICTGPRIRVIMNGTEMIDFDQRTLDAVKDNPLKGYVCLQNHGSKIEFRNIWIKEIKGNTP